jgi:uncharacterized phiE125 gp8 family phage protein
MDLISAPSSIVRISPPTVEPVGTEELGEHARITSEAELAMMLAYLEAAREWCEAYTERAFIWQRWRQTYDAAIPDVIRLKRSPLIVEAGSPASPVVAYYDAAGVLAAYTTFVVNADADPPVIRPAYNASWPIPRTYEGEVLSVTFTAGYGTTATAVPAPIRQAIRLLATTWFDSKEALTPERLEEIPFGVKALLAPYRSRWMHAA